MNSFYMPRLPITDWDELDKATENDVESTVEEMLETVYFEKVESGRFKILN